MSIKSRVPVIVALLAALAACSKPAPPPPPPPPPRLVIPTPPRPVAPNGAQENLALPALDASGLRQSVNRNITPAQALWNLRSALNVAALDCMAPRHADIVVNYQTFLKTYGKQLTAANRKVDAEFRAKYGSGYITPRELYMTSVYNHFALPPTLDDFCDAVQAVNRDMVGLKPAELEQFAGRSLPNIEIVFDNFYRRYEEWRTELATWKAQWQPNSAYSATPSLTAAPMVPTGTGGQGLYGPSAYAPQAKTGTR